MLSIGSSSKNEFLCFFVSLLHQYSLQRERMKSEYFGMRSIMSIILLLLYQGCLFWKSYVKIMNIVITKCLYMIDNTSNRNFNLLKVFFFLKCKTSCSF